MQRTKEQEEYEGLLCAAVRKLIEGHRKAYKYRAYVDSRAEIKQAKHLLEQALELDVKA